MTPREKLHTRMLTGRSIRHFWDFWIQPIMSFTGILQIKEAKKEMLVVAEQLLEYLLQLHIYNWTSPIKLHTFQQELHGPDEPASHWRIFHYYKKEANLIGTFGSVTKLLWCYTESVALSNDVLSESDCTGSRLHADLMLLGCDECWSLSYLPHLSMPPLRRFSGLLLPESYASDCNSEVQTCTASWTLTKYHDSPISSGMPARASVTMTWWFGLHKAICITSIHMWVFFFFFHFFGAGGGGFPTRSNKKICFLLLKSQLTCIKVGVSRECA